MKRLLVRPLGAAMALALIVVALMPEPSRATPADDNASVDLVATTTKTGCKRPVAFRPSRFGHPTRINNTFLPLVPGTRFTFEGTANRGGGPTNHPVVFTVTNLVKWINGVKTRVVLDLDSGDGQLQEAELAMFAQDNAGNVWSMGEYPEEYTDGKLDG